MRLRLIISTLVTLFTANLYADITIHYDSVRQSQTRPAYSVQLKQNLVRISHPEGKQADIMINLMTGDLVQLNPKTKSFFKINTSTLNQYVSLYRENKGLMQGLISQGIKHLDTQKQGQIQQMLQQFEQNSASPESISLKNTGYTDRLLGVQCKIYAISDQGKRTSDVCIAEYQQLELSQQDIESFEQLKKLAQQFEQSTPEKQDMLSMIVNGLEKIKGIPLKIVNYYPSGNIKSVIQAGSISLRSVPKIAYQIPPDFQQKLAPLL